MRRVLLLVMAAVLPLVPVAHAKAATSAQPGTNSNFNLTVSSLPINLVTKPGQSVSTPIQVQNNGSQSVRIKVTIMKFGANGSSGQPTIQDPTPQDSFVSWASASQTSFEARPGVFNTINITIKPPKSAAFGYYYAIVFSQDDGKPVTNINQSRINGAVASLILLNVEAAGEKRKLEVVSFTSNRKLYQYLPASFTVNVKNNGNIHTIPSGNIFISRSGSKDFISTLSINKEQGNVLPKTSRDFSAEWDNGFPSYQIKRQNGQIVSDKSGKPVRELKWNVQDADSLRFGKYTASMTLVYNDGQRDIPVEGEVSFWVIPWIPILIILALLSLVLFGLFVIARSFIKKIKKTTRRASKNETHDS